MTVPADSLFEAVAASLTEAAERAVLPRFRALREGDVEEKERDELVTVADRESEALLAARLTGLLPGSRVVGEEAASAEPRLLDGLGSGLVWLVDPLDGTANFVAGDPNFAVMAALLRDGEAVGAWVENPLRRERWVAARGAGTYRNSVRVRCEPGPGHAASLRGAVLTRFLPPELNARVEARSARFAAVLPGVRCAGVEYPSIVEGDQHFALFWRTLPWDHVPGALLLQEAGGRAARTDGTEFRADRRGTGLLAASSAAAWDEVRRELLGD